MYAGTVWLIRTEDEVWKLTPRKLQALLEVHYDILRQQNGEQPLRNKDKVTGYIDEIPGW